MKLQNIKAYFILYKKTFFSFLIIIAGWLVLNIFYDMGKACRKSDKIEALKFAK